MSHVQRYTQQRVAKILKCSYEASDFFLLFLEIHVGGGWSLTLHNGQIQLTTFFIPFVYAPTQKNYTPKYFSGEKALLLNATLVVTVRRHNIIWLKSLHSEEIQEGKLYSGV